LRVCEAKVRFESFRKQVLLLLHPEDGVAAEGLLTAKEQLSQALMFRSLIFFLSERNKICLVNNLHSSVHWLCFKHRT